MAARCTTPAAAMHHFRGMGAPFRRWRCTIICGQVALLGRHMQLRAEKERAETQLAQEKHKLNRLENRKKYLEKGERQKRTHRLCNLGGTIESLAPEVKNLTRTEMTELMEHIFGLPEVQRAVRHMEITHINQANRGKELKANGTIPLHSNPNETQ